MITGLNHNIKHSGILFHIQTEDSGTKRPHVICHLFIGGSILATERKDYAEFLDLPEDERTAKIREVIKRTHKGMIHKLVTGGFDELARQHIAANPEAAAHAENAHAAAQRDAFSPEAPSQVTELAESARASAVAEVHAEVETPAAGDEDDLDPRTLDLYTLMGVTRRGAATPQRVTSLRVHMLRSLGEATEGNQGRTNF